MYMPTEVKGRWMGIPIGWYTESFQKEIRLKRCFITSSLDQINEQFDNTRQG